LIDLIQLLVFAYDSQTMSVGGGQMYWVRGGNEELGLRGEIAKFTNTMAVCLIDRRLGLGGEYFEARKDELASEFEELVNNDGMKARTGDPTFARILNDLSLVLLSDLIKTASEDNNEAIFDKQLQRIRPNLSSYGDGHGLLFDRIVTGAMEVGFPKEAKDIVCELFEEWIQQNRAIDGLVAEKYLALLLRFGRKKSYALSEIRLRVQQLLNILSPSDVKGDAFSVSWNSTTDSKTAFGGVKDRFTKLLNAFPATISEKIRTKHQLAAPPSNK